LVQIIVWLISANFLLRMASSTWGSVLGSLQITPEFLFLGIVYFILGYLLMAILMAGVGSISPTAVKASKCLSSSSCRSSSRFILLPLLWKIPIVSP